MAQHVSLKNFGMLVFTGAVNDCVADNPAFAKLVTLSLRRHMSGDWGDVSAEDKRENTRAAKEGDRLLSAYRLTDVTFTTSTRWPGDATVWIITEADRSVTTVLFPSEY
jgi:hypothetical protein